MSVPRVQLKVFAPLAAFSPPERRSIEAALDRGEGLSRSAALDLEVAWADRGLRHGIPPADPERFQIRRVGGEVMVCPLQLELRTALALADLATRVPGHVLDAVLPDPARTDRLARLVATAPHVRDHPFHAPLSWFLAFRPEEQRYTDPPEGRGPRLVHLTTVGAAATRLERVVEVVASVLIDPEDLTTELLDLSAWARAFPPDALLELDHATAGQLRGGPSLRRDSTCAQLWRAVESLEAGDDHAAAVAYAAARAGWAIPRALAHAS